MYFCFFCYTTATTEIYSYVPTLSLHVALPILSVWLRRRFGWHAGRVLFRPLLARIAPKLRLLVSGGAALEERLIWQLEGLGWTVRNGYGLAETASIFTGNLPGRERIGSEGQPFQGGELRIAERGAAGVGRPEEHTSELQPLTRTRDG